jgi:5-methylcytosine-specific restriction endonuclease McrA
MAEPIAEALRQLVTARAQGRCEYCQRPEAYATERFSIEHIQPRTLQGPIVPSHLALACQGCNSYKSVQTTSIDPEIGETVEFFHPRRHV